jgi:hypothetical protein
MKKIFQACLLLVFSLALSYTFAEQVPNFHSEKIDVKSVASGCLPGGGFRYLDIGNVRTRINTGGDMWWDFESAQYEIPKGSGKMSMFAASLWIGGIDVNNQLKLAALRYRQVGNDYWTGPLTIDGSAATDSETCAKFDKHFPINRSQVDEYLAWWDDPASYPDYVIPDAILNWPAHGDVTKGQSYYLAPFYDRDGDGSYDPYSGDFPYYDLTGELCQTLTPTMDAQYYHPDDPNNWLYGILSDQVIKGDQTLWWVFNDKGNIHTETGGDAIGIEIRGQAFAFATNDEINNMTFYSYEIINRSTFTLRETYFSQWVDPDLGEAIDDFIGCDVDRGLGYCYNGTPVDGTGQPWSYGEQPPAIGVDFFQGPYMDRIEAGQPLYGQDRPAAFDESGNLLPCDIIRELQYPEAINGVNFGDGIANNERFGMRRFTYFNNTTAGAQPYQTDPQVAIDYYNYLRGIWKDGTKMLYGGNGHETAGGYGPETDFLFPGDSDPCMWSTGFQTPNGPIYWTEETAANPPNDRRFLQSAGPFTLRPGAVNYITVGIPWARAASGGPWASVELLRVVDDKCQALFDNCFQVVDGPNAPDLTFRELDKELIVYLTNRRTNDAGNNFNEAYTEVDYNIVQGDSLYVFEGYQVFQLKNASVSASDIKDPDLARLVFQVDVKNGASKLVNYYYDQSLGANVPVMEVNGANAGIRNSFTLTQDAFTNEPLVNHKQYYYLALAYAYNEYEKYSTDPNAQVPGQQSLSGQTKPYLAGRRNIKVYTAIPHITVGPISPVAEYGDGVEITRLQGQGNGGNVLDFVPGTHEEILAKPPVDSATALGNPDYPILYNPTYAADRGPVKVKVIDPLNLKAADFILKFDSMYRQKVFNVTGGAFAFNSGGDTASKVVTTWQLINQTSGEIYDSQRSILTFKEQIFPEIGLAVEIGQVYPPGSYKVGESSAPGGNLSRYAVLAENNGFLEATISFADNATPWLTGIPDIDGGGPFNWIRSGTLNDGGNSDWNMSSAWPRDPNNVYENVIGGTWAPYQLVAFEGQDPVAKFTPAQSQQSKAFQSLGEIASVDIVLTPDKSKWTRSVVIELAPEANLSEGRTPMFDIRSSASVDKDGNFADPEAGSSTNPEDPNYINATGMGWFPGYAINVETGERLNIMYGENSWLVGENGRDMQFNPTSNAVNEAGFVFGGMHNIYIMSTKQLTSLPLPGYKPFAPAYDAGVWLRQHLTMSTPIKRYAWSTAMWVNIPIAVPGTEWLSSEAHIRLRVGKPYARYYSLPLRDSIAIATDTVNNNYPMYSFSTAGIAPITNDIEKAKNDLDLINVVPNPYYAYSSYEVNQLDNRVKVTNLPRKCTVTIYTVNGTLIRQFTKDSDITSIDWDLKNYAGIPIAGGLYIIHVKADEFGERTIKWFGSLRPVDLNAF